MAGAKGQRHSWCGDLHLNEIRGLRIAGKTISTIAELAGVCEKTMESFLIRNRIVGRWGGARHKGQASRITEHREVVCSALCAVVIP